MEPSCKPALTRRLAFGGHRAGEQLYIQPQGGENSVEGSEMLFCQNFSGAIKAKLLPFSTAK